MLGKKEETSSKASRGRTSRRERAIFSGQMVEVLWKEKDLEGTSWKLGWYRGEVQRFDEENNVVSFGTSRIVSFTVSMVLGLL